MEPVPRNSQLTSTTGAPCGGRATEECLRNDKRKESCCRPSCMVAAIPERRADIVERGPETSAASLRAQSCSGTRVCVRF